MWPRILTIAVATAAIATVLGPGAHPAAAAAPTTYYVDCSSRGASLGTSAAPWRSLHDATSHGEFGPGDRILLNRATTCRGQFTPQGSGVKGKPIVLGAYGKGKRPVIAGGGTRAETGALELRNVHDWTIQDLRVTNTNGHSDASTYRSGILLWNTDGNRSSGITVQRNEVNHVVSDAAGRGRPRDFGGISVLSDGGGGFDGLRVKNNLVHDVGRTGIIVVNRPYPRGKDHDVAISGNIIRNTRGDGIVLIGSVKGRVDHNTVAGAANFWPCPRCHGVSPATANAGVWTAQSVSVRIDHNEVRGTRVLGGDGEGLDVDLSAIRTVVEFNYVHDNQGGGVLLCGSRSATVRFNIFENNAKSAVAFIGSIPAYDSAVYNNTIYAAASTKASVVRTFNGLHGSGISFRNNLVYSYGPGKYLWPTRPETSANQLVGTHRTGRPVDSRTVWRDPGLKKPGSGGNGFKTLGGYKPKHPSSFPKGVAIPKTVTHDFFGKRINPAKPPRGAAG